MAPQSSIKLIFNGKTGFVGTSRSVLWASNMPKMRWRPRLCPGPRWGSSRRSPDPPSRLVRGHLLPNPYSPRRLNSRVFGAQLLCPLQCKILAMPLVAAPLVLSRDVARGCRSTRHTVNSSQPKIVWQVDRQLKHRVVTSWPAPQTPCCHCCDELTACCFRRSYAATISESKYSLTLFLNDFLLICSLSIRGKQFHRALPEYWTDFLLKDIFTYRISKSFLCLVSWLWTSLLITK